MKILSVQANARKKSFSVRTRRGEYQFPYAKLPLTPTVEDPVAEAFPDPELEPRSRGVPVLRRVPRHGPLGDFDRWEVYIRDSLIETTISRDVLLLTRIDKPVLLRRTPGHC